MTLVETVEYIRNDEAHSSALAGLQKVREVLTRANEEWMKPHEFERSIGEGCANIAQCDQCDLIQRARALLEKLKLPGLCASGNKQAAKYQAPLEQRHAAAQLKEIYACDKCDLCEDHHQ